MINTVRLRSNTVHPNSQGDGDCLKLRRNSLAGVNCSQGKRGRVRRIAYDDDATASVSQIGIIASYAGKPCAWRMGLTTLARSTVRSQKGLHKSSTLGLLIIPAHRASRAPWVYGEEFGKGTRDVGAYGDPWREGLGIKLIYELPIRRYQIISG